MSGHVASTKNGVETRAFTNYKRLLTSNAIFDFDCRMTQYISSLFIVYFENTPTTTCFRPHTRTTSGQMGHGSFIWIGLMLISLKSVLGSKLTLFFWRRFIRITIRGSSKELKPSDFSLRHRLLWQVSEASSKHQVYYQNVNSRPRKGKEPELENGGREDPERLIR